MILRAAPAASADGLRAGRDDLDLTSRLYYGWIVVAGLSITETVSWGIVYYGFPVMLRPMERDLGFSRAPDHRRALDRALDLPRSWRCPSGAGSIGTAPAAS